MNPVDPIRQTVPTPIVTFAPFRVAESEDRASKQNRDDAPDDDVVEIDGEEIERPQESEFEVDDLPPQRLDLAV